MNDGNYSPDCRKCLDYGKFSVRLAEDEVVWEVCHFCTPAPSTGPEGDGK